jgi:hypothetical protein
MSDPLPAPTFGNLAYNVPLTDIGSGYAAGIAQAGKSIAGAISGVMGGVNEKGEVQPGILEQQRNADDVLAAMQKNNMITKDQYDAVAGKSLGAKQQLLGLYAGQWTADQAQARALALQKGQGAVQIGVEHAKLLDTVDMIRKGYPPGGDVKKMPYRGPTAPAPVAPAPVVAPENRAPAPWKPGSKYVTVQDDNGQQKHAIQTPDGQITILDQ